MYKIDNTINDKVYIGVTINPDRRWAQHRRMKTNCKALRSAMQKHGADNFNFQLLCCGEDTYIDELEIQAIELYNSVAPNGYNLTLGGEGTMYYKWDDKWNPLLGTMKDRELSAKLNIPWEVVGERRKALNIPTYLERCKNIFQENIHLLGDVTDTELAEICGLSASWVQKQRIDLIGGVRTVPRYTITKDHEVYLKDETLSQDSVVELTKLSVGVVRKWRSQNGYKYKNPAVNNDFKVTDEFISDVTSKILTYKEISKKYNISITRVSSWKKKLGVKHEPNEITKEIDLLIINGNSVREIAKQYKIVESRLYERKRQLLSEVEKISDPLLEEPYYSRIVQWDSVCKDLAKEWNVPAHKLRYIKRKYQKDHRRMHPNNLTKYEWLYIRYLYESGICYKGIILNLGLEVNRHDYIQQGLSGKRYADVTEFSLGEVESWYGRGKNNDKT